jgi:hypothetical protein
MTIIPIGIRCQNSDWRFGMTTGEIAFMNLPEGSSVGKLRLTISAASERAAVCWSMRVPVVLPRSRAERKSLASILNCSDASRAIPSVRSRSCSPSVSTR